MQAIVNTIEGKGISALQLHIVVVSSLKKIEITELLGFGKQIIWYLICENMHPCLGRSLYLKQI